MKVTDENIIKAYTIVSKETGLAADKICTNMSASVAFITECYHQSGEPSPFTMTHRLMNIRKAGHLPKARDLKSDGLF